MKFAFAGILFRERIVRGATSDEVSLSVVDLGHLNLSSYRNSWNVIKNAW